MIEITLADGRVLGIEGITLVESMTLAEGTRELSGNRRWCALAATAASIRRVDGIPRPFPTHKKHIEALLKDLEEADVAAITAAEPTTSIEKVEIEYKNLSPYERLKIYELAGELNDVPGWIGPAIVAAAVRKIGEKAFVFPESRADIMALAGALGVVGYTAAKVKMIEAQDAARTRLKDLETAAKN